MGTSDEAKATLEQIAEMLKRAPQASDGGHDAVPVEAPLAPIADGHAPLAPQQPSQPSVLREPNSKRSLQRSITVDSDGYPVFRLMKFCIDRANVCKSIL